MPRVTLSYSVGGYQTKEYDIPQEVIDGFDGPEFMHLIEEYVHDKGLDPVFERDNSDIQLEDVMVNA